MGKSRQSHNSSKPNPDDNQSWVKYSGIAFEITAFNLLVIWGGYKLDKQFANHIPWFIILALIISMVGTLYMIFNRLKND